MYFWLMWMKDNNFQNAEQHLWDVSYRSRISHRKAGIFLAMLKRTSTDHFFIVHVKTKFNCRKQKLNPRHRRPDMSGKKRTVTPKVTTQLSTQNKSLLA